MQLIFNDIGGWEVILILFFILIFFGAKSIPGLARTAGKTMRQIKEASSEIQNEIRKSGEEMKGDLNLKGIIEETTQDIRRPLDQYASDLDEAVKYQPPRRPREAKPPGHAEREEKAPASEPTDPPKQESTNPPKPGTDNPESN